MGSGPCERGVPLLGGARVLLLTMVLIGGLTGLLSGLLGVGGGFVLIPLLSAVQIPIPEAVG